MSKFIHKLKDNLVIFLGVPLIAFGLWLSLFDNENLRVVPYSIVLSLIILLSSQFYFKKKVAWYLYLVLPFVLYIFLQIIFRSSPLLQLKEFEWTHPGWQRGSDVQLVSLELDAHRGSRRINSTYGILIYQYQFNGRIYSTEQSDVARQYTLWMSDDASDLYQLTESKIRQSFPQEQNVVLINSKDPSQSIFFYSQDIIDIRGSWISEFLVILQVLLGLSVFAVIGIGVKKIINPHNTIQTWSKPKRYAFIAVFFIIAWSVLFAGWILFMYIKNSP